jgi:DNA-binding response OmpR family regulator
MMRRKILAIDDDQFWQRLMKRLFRAEYEVQVAGSCAEGVRLAGEYNPDCILLDFHLADGDAIDVCTALRKNGKKLNAPVVIVSSDPSAEITAYAECRAAYFVLKGSQAMTELPAIVERLLTPVEVPSCKKEPGIEPSC